MRATGHGPFHERSSDRIFWLAAGALVLLAITVAHGNALHAGLLFDSVPIILEDPRIQRWESARLVDILLADYWFGLQSNLYRPLTTLSYALNYSVLGNGGDPVGYLVVNLLLHATNALLVIALALRLTRSRAAALLAGLMFAVHPLTTEAVTNVVGRADLLAATGVLAGLLLHLRIARADRFRIGPSLGLLAASTLAVTSKESGIVLVGVLLLHDLVFALPHPISWQRLGAFLRPRLFRSYLWCLAPVACFFVLRSIVFAGGASPPSIADNPLLRLDAVPATLTAAGILLRYLGLLVWPARLSADYSYDSIPLFDGALQRASDWLAVIGGVLLIATVAVAILARRLWPVVSFFMLFFFVTVAPVSNCFFRIGTIMAERLVYLPDVGPIVLLSMGLVRIATLAAARTRRPVPAIAALALLLLGALAYRTASRNRDWQSGEALFSSAVQVSPRSFKAHKSLAGALYLSAGNEEGLRPRIDAILEHAQTAWEILQQLPSQVGFSDLLADLALYQRAKARLTSGSEGPSWLARAEETYRTAIASETAGGLKSNWRVRLGLAEVLRDLGRRDQALATFKIALELAPGPEVLAPYASLLADAGFGHDAVLCALRLITLQPQHDGMWKIVTEYYAHAFPGESTITISGGQRLFNRDHPSVAADLRLAVRQQYDAERSLGRSRSAEGYRRLVNGLLGIDPTEGHERP
jgi:tetratricopeptide (TPR) repeat protein